MTRGFDQKMMWPFGFYFLQFAGFATVGPFMVLYYQELGFTGAQIGLLTGITPLITFLSSTLWTHLADRTGWHRILMSVAMLFGIAAMVAFPLFPGFGSVVAVAVLLNIFLAPVTPFADNATMTMLGERRSMYGRVRIGGTLGYGVAASLAGLLVHRFGLQSAFWGCAAFFTLAFLISQKLIHGGAATRGLSNAASLRALLSNPRWLPFIVIAFSGGLALASFNYLFPYMKELGASESMMGLALTIGTIVELPVLFFAHRLINRFSSRAVLLFSIIVTAVRMLLFALNTSPEWVLVIQVLNGATLALMWVAGVAYANEYAPPGLSTTGQGVFNAMVNGIGVAAGGFIGGPLLERLGGRGLYLVFGLMVLSILAIIMVLERRFHRHDTQSKASPDPASRIR